MLTKIQKNDIIKNIITENLNRGAAVARLR